MFHFYPHPHQGLTSFLLNSHLSKCELTNECPFYFDSLMISNVENLYMDLWPFVYLLWKNVYSAQEPIFKSGCLDFFCYSFGRVPCIFWIITSYKICSAKNFLSFHTLIFFHFVRCFFCCAEHLS